MKFFKIQKWMSLGLMLVFLTCICFVGCTSTSEIPLELLMLVSADDDYENCLEEGKSSKDKKYCDTIKEDIVKQIQMRDVLNNLSRGVIDDDFPCPVGNCPDDMRELLRDDWKLVLSKVVLRKGQKVTVSDNKGNVIAKLIPSSTKSDVFKNHFVGKLSIEKSFNPAVLSINDKLNNTQFTVKIPSN